MKKYTSRKAMPIQFELDGEVFTATGNVPVLRMSELAARRGENGEMDGTAMLASVSETFRSILGPTEYARFAKHVNEYDTDTQVLREIMDDIDEQRSGGTPLEQQPPSPAGTETTPSTWKVISASGEVREEPLTPERLAQLREAVNRQAG